MSRKKTTGFITRKQAERITRKVLLDQMRRTWQKEIAGKLDFLERMDALKRPDTDSWFRGQSMYYHKQIKMLLSISPQGCNKLAETFRLRLSKVRSFE